MSRFDTTRWSVVLRAGSEPADARGALETLCRTYREPVLAFIRHKGYAPDVAEDLAQAFFARFLERAWYANADPERGRFRSFLLTVLKRFLIDADSEAAALKRGGAFRFESFEGDDAAHAASDRGTPECEYERAWAHAVLDAALARLRSEAAYAGKLALFERLSEFLFEAPDASDYARAAEDLHLRRNTLAVTVHRLRQRLRELVREELADTTDGRAALDAELHVLRDALGQMP